MPIASYKTIDGTLTLGSGPLAAAAQVLSASVVASEKVKETDPTPVLSGEELTGDSSATLSFRLKGKVLQDALAAGLVAYTWAHAGEEVAFVLTPNDAESGTVEGTVRVVPITVGGDVSKTDRARSDFDWACVGVAPEFTPLAP